jgi:hypothetical protein
VFRPGPRSESGEVTVNPGPCFLYRQLQPIGGDKKSLKCRFQYSVEMHSQPAARIGQLNREMHLCGVVNNGDRWRALGLFTRRNVSAAQVASVAGLLQRRGHEGVVRFDRVCVSMGALSSGELGGLRLTVHRRWNVLYAVGRSAALPHSQRLIATARMDGVR